MAAARQRAEWLRVGVATGWVAKADPLKIIPEAYWPTDDREVKTQEEVEYLSKLGWKAIHQMLGNL